VELATATIIHQIKMIMTNKQISQAFADLPKEQRTSKNQVYRELKCREMINAIMIYGNIDSPYDEETGLFDHYMEDFAFEGRYLYVGRERCLELIKEQQESFKTAKVIESVSTDYEGMTYNACYWPDDEQYLEY
jgi:hypothetical protein